MKAKITIMKARPAITDEEIRGHMNFDRLLELQKQPAVPRKFPNKYLLIAGLVVVVGIFSWIIVDRERSAHQEFIALPADKQQPSPVQNPVTNPDTVRISPPLNESKEGDSRKQKIDHAEQTQPVRQKKNESPNVTNEKEKIESEAIDDKPGDLVYIQAEPVNGYPNLYDYFNRELRYPEEAMKDSLQGEVIAVFTINNDGKPEKIVIENSLGPLFDKEVVRLITNMPPWKPATYNNKPRASKMSLPLTFQIKKITLQK
jgi:TonB family protein